MSRHHVDMTINGRRHASDVDARVSLADFLRDDAGYTGVHVGCEHGVCGACTVIVDGAAIRSCLLFAVQADGAEITTVEGLGTPGTLTVVQEAFREEHGLQCGFCTPGMLMTGYALLQHNTAPTEEEIRWAISGNLCRCTGYVNIVKAVQHAAEKIRQGEAS